jgi:hypothetical protein
MPLATHLTASLRRLGSDTGRRLDARDTTAFSTSAVTNPKRNYGGGPLHMSLS